MLLLLREVDHRGVGSVLLRRGYAVLRVGLRLVSLADRDDLTVPGLVPEAELELGVLVQLELARHAALHLRDHHAHRLTDADLYHGQRDRCGCSAGTPRRKWVSTANSDRANRPTAEGVRMGQTISHPGERLGHLRSSLAT